jgi:hypothetical protein
MMRALLTGVVLLSGAAGSLESQSYRVRIDARAQSVS